MPKAIWVQERKEMKHSCIHTSTHTREFIFILRALVLFAFCEMNCVYFVRMRNIPISEMIRDSDAIRSHLNFNRLNYVFHISRFNEIFFFASWTGGNPQSMVHVRSDNSVDVGFWVGIVWEAAQQLIRTNSRQKRQ